MGLLRRSGGSRGAGTHAAVRLPVALALLAVAVLGCAPSGGGRSDPLPGPGGRLDPIYDFTLSWPEAVVVVGGLTYVGVTVDLAVAFEDASVRDADLEFRAPVTVVSVVAGGVVQTFAVLQPIVMTGTLDGPHLATDLFGSIQFGTANLVMSLDGTLADDRRTLEGTAAIYGTSTPGTFAAVRRRRYLVAGSDLASTVGQVALVERRYDSQATLRENLETISSDPAARVTDGRPFVVNRLSYDNLQGLDPASDFKTVLQDTTGNGSNPHDLEVLPGNGSTAGIAWVTRYEPPYDDVAFYDLDDGGLLGSVDLVPYATNADGLPRADQILAHDGLLYVTLQDANRNFTVFGNGRVAVIDPATRAVVSVIDLAGQNPFESLEYAPSTGLIYVGLAGIFPGLRPQALTGGIEVIDPETRQSRGLLVDDDDLGGNVSAVAVISAARGYAVVSDASFHTRIRAFDVATGEVLGTIYETNDLISTMIADGDGDLLVAERNSFSPRLLIFKGDDGQPLAALPLSIPPLSLAILTRSL
ncbi:MAG TPA: hypothetical protein VJV75_04980 [Candidatus Polarisedimenticolia bacterium]|nr:hypothetical protein [Candidatus Polarisedimenticolia bacterium]